MEYRIIGPPGCGKTTYIARQVHAAVDSGRTVMVASLTRAAAAEAAGRNLPNVGTLHSHCYKALGHPEIADTAKGLKEWNHDHPDLALSGGNDVDDFGDTPGKTKADKLMAIYQGLRARMATVYPDYLEKLFIGPWNKWKDANGLIDFTDMIEICLRDVDTAPGGPDVIFLDEAQDMDALESSGAQWRPLRAPC